jgi:hypothetical protein
MYTEQPEDTIESVNVHPRSSSEQEPDQRPQLEEALDSY